MIVYDASPGTGRSGGDVDYRNLYEMEERRNRVLMEELEVTRSQAETYSRELINVFMHSKKKRRELADANNQLVRFASDLRKTITDLRHAHRELQDAYRDTIFRLVLASEYKDKDTGNHISRMSRYSIVMADKTGLMQREIDNIAYAAPMHDVGKIGIPDSIILKNGMLSEQEFSIVKSHTTIGAVILENARGAVLQTAHTIALSHHEQWNGGGYPHGLKRDAIPLPARIVALTDTFDALTSRRPYKAPYPIDISCDIIKTERGKHFDPDLVDLFLDHIDEFVNIKRDIDKMDPECLSEDIVWSERDLTCHTG